MVGYIIVYLIVIILTFIINSLAFWVTIKLVTRFGPVRIKDVSYKKALKVSIVILIVWFILTILATTIAVFLISLIKNIGLPLVSGLIFSGLIGLLFIIFFFYVYYLIIKKYYKIKKWTIAVIGGSHFLVLLLLNVLILGIDYIFNLH